MKTKLLLLLFLSITILGYAQTDIEQFQSTTGSQYRVVTGTINQSATGVNVSWDFTGLTNTAITMVDNYTDTPPTSIIETSNGSTVVSTVGLTTDGISGVLSVTSVLAQGVQLNYTNPAIIGIFPLGYSYSNTDTVEGTFSISGNDGDVLNTSTVSVNVDAWGNLKVGNFDGVVTRLKLVQSLNLSAAFGFVTGTGTQTSYFYYDANNSDLVFRTNRVQIEIPSLSISIDDITMESLLVYTLGISDYQVAESDVKLVSNPIQDVLRFSVSDFIEIKDITILDISGRVVLKSKVNTSLLDVKSLKTGLFLASITTNKGIVTKKFVKK